MTLKISLCTVCMNRLHHIKQTLPENIKHNQGYPNVEFVLLDYNSSDGLGEWVKQEMKDHLQSGVLKYYRTEDFPYFNRSHSRNMMFKLATGDILCNVDADNYTGENFAHFIASEFSKDTNIYVVADTQKRYYFLRNAFGRFCVKKYDFDQLRGLDEEMISYGSETVDLYNRLDQSGLKEVVIQDTRFLETISHGDEERISNEFFLQSLDRLFIRFISHEESEFIILYKDKTFESGYLVPEKVETHLPASLKENSFIKGDWEYVSDRLILNDNRRKRVFNDAHDKVISDNQVYYLMDDKQFLLNVAKNYSFITNVDKKNKNLRDQVLRVNANSYGSGNVHDFNKQEFYIQ